MKEYTLESIAAGVSHAFEVIVTPEMMDAIRAFTGEANALPADADFAESKGYRDRLVYGMLTASFSSTLVGVYLPGRNAVLPQVDVSFRNPVFPGDRLTIRGEVVSVSS